MKKLTCKQLGGVCDFEIQGESLDEMIEKAKAHGMEMFTKGDEAHMQVMEDMKAMMNDSDALRSFTDGVQREFDAAPEL